MSISNSPLVSVIVRSKNSEATIERSLESITRQTYKNIEIILVDNYSKDRTREIAKKYVKLILLRGPERSAQVNFGVRHAKGKYVYIVDSDFILEPTIVEEAVSKCELGGLHAVLIHNSSDPDISFWAKVRKLERDCYLGDELNVAARFVRKDAFETIGGFNEQLVAGEDYDFHNRLLKAGFKIGWINAKEVHIGEPKSLSEIVKKHYYYGKTLVGFLEKHRERGLKQLSPARLSYIRNWKSFIKHPTLALGFVVYQVVRYLSAIVGFLVSKLEFR